MVKAKALIFFSQFRIGMHRRWHSYIYQTKQTNFLYFVAENCKYTAAYAPTDVSGMRTTGLAAQNINLFENAAIIWNICSHDTAGNESAGHFDRPYCRFEKIHQIRLSNT